MLAWPSPSNRLGGAPHMRPVAWGYRLQSTYTLAMVVTSGHKGRLSTDPFSVTASCLAAHIEMNLGRSLFYQPQMDGSSGRNWKDFLLALWVCFSTVPPHPSDVP